jgi:hypothetical protein
MQRVPGYALLCPDEPRREVRVRSLRKAFPDLLRVTGKHAT